MCNNCIHKAVCSKFAATGGYVRECEHFKFNLGEPQKLTMKTIPTVCGYNAEALALIAELLRKHFITEDELDILFGDFCKMYEIIIREQKTIISEAMATFQWPSVGEVAEMMWEERNCGADMRGEKHETT